MSKEEFLSKLRKRINILEDSEIEDIISEYEGYIEEKVNAGATEEEAVKELGDLDEIVSDLLAAYKVKDKSNENGFNNVINKVSNAIDNFMDSLDDKSGRDIIRILVEVIIILLAICILRIPFSMIKDLGADIFYEISNPVASVLRALWYFIVEFSYIIVAVVFFIKTIEKRYFKKVSERIVDEVEEETSKEEVREQEKKEKKKRSKKEVTDETIPERKTEPKKVVEYKKHGVVDALVDVCIIMLKIIALFIVMGVVCYLIGMSIALGAMIYLLVNGVTYYGIFLLLVALFLGGVFVLKLIINFITNKKIKSISIFGELMTFIVVLGIGITMSAVEIGSTEFIYDNSGIETKKVEKIVPIKNDKLNLYYYDNIMIDNTLSNEVRIEYVYPAFNDIELDIELEECAKGYCLYSNVNYFRWNKKGLDYLIEHLKDKKIYAHDFTVTKNIYVSEADQNKISGSKYYYNDNRENEYTFTRTYHILNMTTSHEDDYVYLTLRDNQLEEEVKTVKVLKLHTSNIEIGKDYEFTFSYRGYEPVDDIEEIFEECTLISIKPIANQGIDQTQGF